MVLHVSAGDAIPEASVDQISPHTTAQCQAVVGTALALRGELHPQEQFAQAPARTSADRLSVIPLSPGRIPVTPPSDRFRADALDRTRTCSVARASILIAASADMAIADSATRWPGAEAAGADTAAATAGAEAMDTGEVTDTAEAIGPATVGAVASSLGVAGVGASV